MCVCLVACVRVMECGQWGRCLCHRGDLWACSVASCTVQDIVLWHWRVSLRAVRTCARVRAQGLQVSLARHNQSTAGQCGPGARDHLTLASIVASLSLMNTGQVGLFVRFWRLLELLELSAWALRNCHWTLQLPPSTSPTPSHTPQLSLCTTSGYSTAAGFRFQTEFKLRSGQQLNRSLGRSCTVCSRWSYDGAASPVTTLSRSPVGSRWKSRQTSTCTHVWAY